MIAIYNFTCLKGLDLDIFDIKTIIDRRKSKSLIEERGSNIRDFIVGNAVSNIFDPRLSITKGNYDLHYPMWPPFGK